MRWVATVLIFSATMFIGELAAGMFWQPGETETDESPHAYHGSHDAAAPVGVRVMYAG